jgi:hypothetical protein
MMGMEKYIKPEFEATCFTCPHCEVVAQQHWHNGFVSHIFNGWSVIYKELSVSICEHCKQKSVWLNKSLIDPRSHSIPPAHGDMQPSVKELYEEAADIFERSPRAAAALLRLSLEKLCIELGIAKNDNLKAMLTELTTKKQLKWDTLVLLHLVRETGNSAVHSTGLIFDEDNQEDMRGAIELAFGDINQIVDELITKPKKMQERAKKLPENLRKEIAGRTSSNV